MVIYLARPLLTGSSDLTRSDTDVFSVGASNSRIGTYLVLLRAEIGRLTPAISDKARLCPLWHQHSWCHARSMPEALPSAILTSRWAAVSRCAAPHSSLKAFQLWASKGPPKPYLGLRDAGRRRIRSPDFPPPPSVYLERGRTPGRLLQII